MGIYDAIVIGGGHNGLTCASYLSKFGKFKKVLVLERRHLIGGAAVTEEIVKGYRFSRCSYLAGLLRGKVIDELDLKNKYGLEFIPRDPSSFTPTLTKGEYLLLGKDSQKNFENISKFSKDDASSYNEYGEMLGNVEKLLNPFFDSPLPNFPPSSFQDAKLVGGFAIGGMKKPETINDLYKLFLSPAQDILNEWFKSDILKTTLATDAVIGAMLSPKEVGSGYILLHHAMGTWSYCKGGMGEISRALGDCARDHGVEIQTNASVDEILLDNNDTNKVSGVKLADGTILQSNCIISCTTPYQTFMSLLPQEFRDGNEKFVKQIENQDFSCGSFKINLALNKLPNFICYPTTENQELSNGGEQHYGTIHFESKMEMIHQAYKEASQGIPAKKPVIEMTIPSTLDNSLVDIKGHHIAQLFVQYAPYDLADGNSWDDNEFKTEFVDRVLNIVEEYAPGFKKSIVGIDALSPKDLETIFGLHKGNIFHGSMALHQMGYGRPKHKTPLSNLFIGSAGTHPGGGVSSAPGKNVALTVMKEMK